MAGPPTVRIIVKPLPGGGRTLSLYDVYNARYVWADVRCGPGQRALDEKVLEVKTLLEKKGNRVEVKILS